MSIIDKALEANRDYAYTLTSRDRKFLVPEEDRDIHIIR